MRSASFAVVLFSLLTHVAPAGDEAPSQPLVDKYRLRARPEAFKTLVNPNCSHCVDEAKRRGRALRDDDRVLAWIRGKYDGGAIPVRFFLAPYRVISDTYGVFVYDPEAGFMRGFEPSLEFRFHGWRNGVMVMRHSDGTLYSALSGIAFDGPRKGDRLEPIATLEGEWKDWLKRYPETVAYHMFDKYQPVELPGDENTDSVATRGPPDPRLPASREVLGIALEGQARAYPLAALEKSGGVIADTFAGQKILILWYQPTRTAAIYAAETDDPEMKQPVTLSADQKSSSAPFTDRETGSHWDIAGRATSGESKGKTLRWLPGVQCRWFAWSAEFPQTEIYETGAARPGANRKVGSAGSEKSKIDRAGADSDRQNPARPMEGVIVEAADVSPEKVENWAQSGRRAVAVVLDESTSPESYASAARMIGDAKLDLYYWIEIARNKALADAHPRWMASLGMHDDWQKRFPGTALPDKDTEVAKAYPWVPIGYREAFDAHLERVGKLMNRAAGPFRGLLLNDLQGGPASCGCGNRQCRWAIDYKVPATATSLGGADVAVRFLAAVRKRIPGKEIVPIWMTECEDVDLPPKLRAGGTTTGLCGSVPCAANTCPKVFAAQWSPLVAEEKSAVGLLVLQNELERNGPRYAASPWVTSAVNYVDTIPAQHGKAALPHGRLWLILEGHRVSPAEQAAARAAALETAPAAIFVALTRLDQSYEPRVIPVK